MATFTASVIANADNGYDDNTNNDWRSGTQSTGGQLGNDSVNTYKAALRFQNVTIPKGATITSAKITLYTGSLGASGSPNLKIQGIAEDNTAAFSTTFGAHGPWSRGGTSSVVTGWTPTAGANTTYDSPDITSVIQEIINRGGWASGNALGLFVLDNGSPAHALVGERNYPGTPSALLTINYSVGGLLGQSLTYEIKVTKPALTQLLRYSILDQELVPVAFRGLKVAKPGHNVINTKNPNNLNFSSDFNTLKYDLSGVTSIAVNEGSERNVYTKTVAVTHGLNFYPVTIAYVQDDTMPNPQPMGRFQAGSGASRSFFFHITKTQIIFIINGSWLTTPDNYTAYFYYKIFKNDLGL